MATTWSAIDSGGYYTLTNGNATAAKTQNTASLLRGSASKDAGKLYFEIALSGGYTGVRIGVATSSASLTSTLGANAYGWAYGGLNSTDGYKKHNGSQTDYYGQGNWGASDVVGVAVDFSAGTILFTHNGASSGQAYSNIPGEVFPAIDIWNSAVSATLKTDAADLTYSPPSGYSAWDTVEAPQAIDSYTKSLLHLNSDLTDESGKAWTAYGGAAISTSIKKFGAGSLNIGGGKYIATPVVDDFNFGTGDFSIDFWFYRNFSPYTYHSIVDFRASDNSLSPAIAIDAGGRLYSYGLGGTAMQYAGTVPYQQWCHVYLGRIGTASYLAVDGDVYTGTSGSSIGGAAIISVGKCSFSASYSVGDSYIDELRISKGVCRWTTDFTPPTAEYGASTSVDKSWLMTLFNGAIKGIKGVAKSAIPFYDGDKWEVKEAGTPGQVLSINDEGDLDWKTLIAGADLIEVADQASLPGVGAVKTIYLALDTNKLYYWKTNAYRELAPSTGGSSNITVGYTAPTDPEINHVWIDLNEGGIILTPEQVIPNALLVPPIPSMGVTTQVEAQ